MGCGVKIIICLGTRPEVIKLYPVIKAFRADPTYETVVLFTGQHRDLGQQALDEFEIVPDITLSVMTVRQTLSELTARLHQEIGRTLEDHRDARLLIVQGDTTTAYVGALEAFYHRIPVAHVEAGLRTGNLAEPFPEELNRMLIDEIASLRFEPGKYGNTVIDTLHAFAPKGIVAEKMVLVTLHRRESFGRPMRSVMEALLKFVDTHREWTIEYPVHPNPEVKQLAYEKLGGHSRIKLLPALSYKKMLMTMARCSFIVTDSGGVQEEAPSMHKPVLVVRNKTERTEVVEVGAAWLVGTSGAVVCGAMERLVTDAMLYNRMSSVVNPYGDGRATERIKDKIDSWLLPVG